MNNQKSPSNLALKKVILKKENIKQNLPPTILSSQNVSSSRSQNLNP